jgi:CheY-like chemotaxis protein
VGLNAPGGEPGPRVLLVEDNDVERETMRELLEDEGIVVVGAAPDGFAGVELARALVPEVVLMDMRMPGLDGIEATRLIKEVHPDVQVIILTAYADSYVTRSAEEVGCYAYLVKGCSPAFIRDVVVQACTLARGLAGRRVV